MNDDYDKWMNDSPKWRDALGRKLDEHRGSQMVVVYSSVAFAFPDKLAHPSTFEYPRIDQTAVREWVASKGWGVRFLREHAGEEDTHSPDVLFTKND